MILKNGDWVEIFPLTPFMHWRFYQSMGEEVDAYKNLIHIFILICTILTALLQFIIVVINFSIRCPDSIFISFSRQQQHMARWASTVLQIGLILHNVPKGHNLKGISRSLLFRRCMRLIWMGIVSCFIVKRF